MRGNRIWLSCLVLVLSLMRGIADPETTPVDLTNEIDVGRLVHLLEGNDVEVRLHAAQRLAELHDPAAFTPLANLLKDATPAIRIQAVYAVGAYADPRVVPLMLDMLRDADALVRGAAAYTLAQCKDPGAVPVLLADMQDQNLTLRAGAAQTLFLLHEPLATDLFLAAITDPHSELRLLAAQGLGVVPREKPEVAISALIAALVDDDPGVRSAAADALGRRRAVAAIDPLLGLLADRGHVVPNVESVLQQIGTPVASKLATVLAQEQEPRKLQPLLNLFHAIQTPATIDRLLTLTKLNETRDMAFGALCQPNATLTGSVLADLYESLDGPHDPAFYIQPQRTLWSWTRDPRVLDLFRTSLQQAQPGDDIAVPGTGATTTSIIAASLFDDPGLTTLMQGLLKQPDARLRREALIGLGLTGDPKFLDAAIAGVKDPETNEAAAEFLQRVTALQDATPVLALLAEQEPFTRQCAVETLGRQRDARATPALSSLLENEENGAVRRAAAISLGMIGDARAVDSLINALKDKDVSVENAAALALGEIGDIRAASSLVDALKTDNRMVRTQAAAALCKLGDPRGEDPLLAALKGTDPTAMSIAGNAVIQLRLTRGADLAAPWLQEKDRIRRFASAYLLASMNDARAATPILEFLQTNTNAAIQRYAIKLLSPLKTPLVRPTLARLMEENRDYSVRLTAATVLAPQGDATAIDLLLNAVQNPYLPERVPAARALARVKDARIVPVLLTAAADPEPLVRVLVGHALVRQKEARGTTLLLEALREPREPLVVALAMNYLAEAKERKAVLPLLAIAHKGATEGRLRAIHALGAIGDKSAVAPLIVLLDDDLPRIREGAALALGTLGQGQAADQLIELLRDDATRVRQAAARALGRLKASTAVDPLITALAIEKASLTQTAIVDALHALTAQDIGADAAKWQAWRDKDQGKDDTKEEPKPKDDTKDAPQPKDTGVKPPTPAPQE